VGLGSAVSSQEGSEAEPQPKSNLVHFKPYNVTFGGNNFNDIPENQLTWSTTTNDKSVLS